VKVVKAEPKATPDVPKKERKPKTVKTKKAVTKSAKKTSKK
jgi:hypothetical protein